MRTKDWRDADVVFVNSTCYDEPLMDKIGDIASKLPSIIFSLIFHDYFSYDSGNEERLIFHHVDKTSSMC